MKVWVLYFFIFSTKGLLAADISISVLTGLNFGTVTQGDPPKIIPPSNINTGENASFRVTGDPNTTYNINLPESATMSNGASSLTISNFTSNPSFSGGGLFDTSGIETIYVGGTLQAIPFNIKTGDYNGTFVIDVSY
jgi:hypothetical protein